MVFLDKQQHTIKDHKEQGSPSNNPTRIWNHLLLCVSALLSTKKKRGQYFSLQNYNQKTVLLRVLNIDAAKPALVK